MCFAETGNSSVGTGNCSTLMPVCFLLQIFASAFRIFSRKLYVIILYHKIANPSSSASSFSASSFRFVFVFRFVFRRFVFFDPHHPVFETQAGVRQVQLRFS
jgi:hypothetical protein